MGDYTLANRMCVSDISAPHYVHHHYMLTVSSECVFAVRLSIFIAEGQPCEKSTFVYGSKTSCCPYFFEGHIGHDTSKLVVELPKTVIF